MFNSAHFHPMMVHFPIAIITVGFFADMLGLLIRKEKCLSRMGYWLEVIGMITALIAYATGYFFTTPMDGEAGQMRDQHEFFATLTLIGIFVATMFRILIRRLKKEDATLKYLSLILFFISFAFVSFTGYLGGRLVIDFMIGL
ncbi:MAG: DUF2231 domain-containing protein [Alphaproteobacteria bacterium]|nr:DUF2231 domain-containing protein [Alphaproteobacteria bacterium]